MSILIAPSHPSTSHRRATWAERRAERRRLKRQDVLSARLAELLSIGVLIARAVEVVRRGWVQDAWFAVDSANGTRVVTAYDLRMAEIYPVTGACLVGAVVHAAGGPASVKTQLVQRTLDLTWHTLREDPERPVQWCPGPGARTLQVLELTCWNDAPTRTRDEVVDLLLATQQAATVQRDRCLAESASIARPEAVM